MYVYIGQLGEYYCYIFLSSSVYLMKEIRLLVISGPLDSSNFGFILCLSFECLFVRRLWTQKLLCRFQKKLYQ